MVVLLCCLWLFWLSWSTDLVDLPLVHLVTCSSSSSLLFLAPGLLSLLLLGLVLQLHIALAFGKDCVVKSGWICGVVMDCVLSWDELELGAVVSETELAPLCATTPLPLSFPSLSLCAGDSTECGKWVCCLLAWLPDSVNLELRLVWYYPSCVVYFWLPSGFRPVMLFWG